MYVLRLALLPLHDLKNHTSIVITYICCGFFSGEGESKAGEAM